MAQEMQNLWSGSSGSGAPHAAGAEAVGVKSRSSSLWWYVMLLLLVVALAEAALASGYLGTQREEA